jgi:hypothetical protein
MALHDRVASRWCLLLFEVATSKMAWGLVIKAREKIVRCSEGGFLRGIVLTPWGSRRATLVERVIELPSLSG